ncbi:MAG TPA: hypothetical protein VH393_06040 [Ktedonobacterales bacterium]|jgi:hypothetical protein
MNGVGQEPHAARDQDDEELEERRGAEDEQRDFKRPDPALTALQRGVDTDLAVTVAMEEWDGFPEPSKPSVIMVMIVVMVVVSVVRMFCLLGVLVIMQIMQISRIVAFMGM